MRRIIRRREISRRLTGATSARPLSAAAAAASCRWRSCAADPDALAAAARACWACASAPADRVEDLQPQLAAAGAGGRRIPRHRATVAATARRSCCATRFGFNGELRAVGAGVRQDLMFLLARCGFDAFELAAGEDPRGGAAGARRATTSPTSGAAAVADAAATIRAQRFFA